jgi:hypothetical protein
MPSLLSLSRYLVTLFASVFATAAGAFSQGLIARSTRRSRNAYTYASNPGRRKQNDHHSRNGFQQGFSRYETVQFNKWLHRLTDPQRAQDALLGRIDSGSRDFDTVSFNLVMTAWARDSNADRARAIFRHLKELSSSSSSTFTHLKVDAFSFAAVLNALAKCKGGREAALRAHELLTEMLDTLPSIPTDVCHNAVLNTWSVSGEADAGVQAQALLDDMVEAKLATRIS